MSATVLAGQGPEVEVVAKAARRRFTVEYKRKIVREADACKTPGAVGALLRATRSRWRGTVGSGIVVTVNLRPRTEPARPRRPHQPGHRTALRTPTVTCVILTGPSLASTTLAA